MKTIYIIMHGLGTPTQYIFSDKNQADKFAFFKNTIGTGYYFVQEQKVYDSFGDYKEEDFDDYLRSLHNKAFHLYEDKIYSISLLSETTSAYRDVKISARKAEEWFETLRDCTKFWVQGEDDEYLITKTSTSRLKEIVNESNSAIQNVMDEIDKASEDYTNTEKYREENQTKLPF